VTDGKLPFSLSVRVYWEDTDAGGVVYHASYLRFLERARSEWLRALGIAQESLRLAQDRVFAIAGMEIAFRLPARLDDLLDVTVERLELGGASMVFHQRLLRGEQVLVDASVRVACLVASSFRPCPIPPSLRQQLGNAAFRRTE